MAAPLTGLDQRVGLEAPGQGLYRRVPELAHWDSCERLLAPPLTLLLHASTVQSMPGLELAVMDVATKAEIPLALGASQPWLTGRGHLSTSVERDAPSEILDALAAIHLALGGDAVALAGKRRGPSPTPDLVYVPTGQIVEVDEVQHFTSARRATLERYPADAPLGFERSHYVELIDELKRPGFRDCSGYWVTGSATGIV